MRKFLTVLVGLIAIVAGSISMPITARAAEYPSHPFEIKYVNTYTKGTVTFYNRKVRVAGGNMSFGGKNGCRLTSAYTYASRYPDYPNIKDSLGYNDSVLSCGSLVPFTFDVAADVVGGAGSVMVEFQAQKSDGEFYVVANLLIRR